MKIFLSHSSADNQYASALAQMLRDQDAEVWYDSSSLGLGHLEQTILQALTDYPVFVVVLSPEAFASDYVYQECFLASRLLSEEPNRAMLPIVARQISFQDFRGRWLFLEPFRRIAVSGFQPLPQDDAFEQVRRELFPGGECDLPAGATAEQLTERGKAYCFQKKFDCAVRFLKRATELRPDYFSAWHNLAWSLFEGERYAEARVACDRALALRPNNSYAWGLSAYILQALQLEDEALVATDRALAINPGYGRVWSTRGWLHYYSGHFDEAQYAFEQALSAQKRDPTGDPERGIALCLSKRGRFDEALARCDQLLSNKPLFAVNWHVKGRILQEAYQYEQALAAYNEALSLDPKLIGTWERKAELLKALGREPEARHAARQAQQLKVL